MSRAVSFPCLINLTPRCVPPVFLAPVLSTMGVPRLVHRWRARLARTAAAAVRIQCLCRSLAAAATAAALRSSRAATTLQCARRASLARRAAGALRAANARRAAAATLQCAWLCFTARRQRRRRALYRALRRPLAAGFQRLALQCWRANGLMAAAEVAAACVVQRCVARPLLARRRCLAAVEHRRRRRAEAAAMARVAGAVQRRWRGREARWAAAGVVARFFSELPGAR